MEVLTVGEIKRDTFVALPSASILCKKHEASCSLCFAYGEKIPVGAFFTQIGGTAANVATGIKKMGFSSGIISTVGTNNEDSEALQTLKQAHIETKYITQKKHVTMSHAVVLNFKGESTQLIAQNPGSQEFPKNITVPKILHICEITNKYQKTFKDILAFTKKHKEVLISMNPGIKQILDDGKEFLELLKQTDILFINKKEASLLAKLPQTTSPAKIIKNLRALCKGTIVLTLGSEGACAQQKNALFFAPIFKGVRIEATGAGDAFSTGFLGGVLAKKSLETCLAWGSINAASVVGFVGPTGGLLTKKEIEKRKRAAHTYHVKKML